jgi:hypothetical protein
MRTESTYDGLVIPRLSIALAAAAMQTRAQSRNLPPISFTGSPSNFFSISATMICRLQRTSSIFLV